MEGVNNDEMDDWLVEARVVMCMYLDWSYKRRRNLSSVGGSSPRGNSAAPHLYLGRGRGT